MRKRHYLILDRSTGETIKVKPSRITRMFSSSTTHQISKLMVGERYEIGGHYVIICVH